MSDDTKAILAFLDRIAGTQLGLEIFLAQTLSLGLLQHPDIREPQLRAMMDEFHQKLEAGPASSGAKAIGHETIDRIGDRVIDQIAAWRK